MKKSSFFTAILFIIFGSTAIAQNPMHPALNVNSGSLSCSDVQIVAYVASASTCSIVGVSNPISVTASSNTDYFYSTISSGAGWATDPGAPTTSNQWEFVGADVYNCNAPSSGGSCFSSFLDGITVGNPGCFTNDNGCFEYSTNCSSCAMGATVICNFSPGSPDGFAILGIDQ